MQSPACKFEDCILPTKATGFCSKHYQQNRRGALGDDRQFISREGHCCVGACLEPIWARELCKNHYGIATRYRMTAEQMTEMFSDAKCESCGDTEFLHVDHDHSCCPTSTTCGKCVRGLLCRGCNRALGHLQESPKRMLALADYIARFTTPV